MTHFLHLLARQNRRLCDCISIAVAVLISLVIHSPAGSQELHWQTDLETAIQMAESEQKLVLLHFTASWSKGCQEIQTFVFPSPRVQRALQTNVIPVQIDVEEQPELTSQYGVGTVPYDIVITPGKRVVSRRQSPKDSANYALMISKLEKTIQQMMQHGESTLNQNLDDFQQVMEQTDPIRQQQSLTPDRPSHQAAVPSQDSLELQRKMAGDTPSVTSKNLVRNPYPPATRASQATVPISPQPNSAGPLKIINPNFVAKGQAANQSRPPVGEKTQDKLREDSNGLVSPSSGSAPAIRPSRTTYGMLNEDDAQSNPGGFPVSTHGSPESFETNLALQGKCPITLIREGRWSNGNKQWGCVHRDRTYLFASREHLEIFLADPDANSPLLAGYDPVVFERTGTLVPGREEYGVFMGKAPHLRVVMFQDMENRREFEANPKKYLLIIQQAMENAGGS